MDDAHYIGEEGLLVSLMVQMLLSPGNILTGFQETADYLGNPLARLLIYKINQYTWLLGNQGLHLKVAFCCCCQQRFMERGLSYRLTLKDLINIIMYINVVYYNAM